MIFSFLVFVLESSWSNTHNSCYYSPSFFRCNEKQSTQKKKRLFWLKYEQLSLFSLTRVRGLLKEWIDSRFELDSLWSFCPLICCQIFPLGSSYSDKSRPVPDNKLSQFAVRCPPFIGHFSTWVDFPNINQSKIENCCDSSRKRNSWKRFSIKVLTNWWKDQQFSSRTTLKESCGVISGKKNRKQRILDWQIISMCKTIVTQRAKN